MAITVQTLGRFVPMNTLSPQALQELAPQVEELFYPPGSVLFRQGDQDTRVCFLLEGEINRHVEGQAPRPLAAGEDDARYALSRSVPRAYTAEAISNTRIARLDEDLLEHCVGRDQATAYEVFEYDGSDDLTWMWDILSRQAFRSVPPAALNAMFERFQPVHCKAGETIVRQGDRGDFFYLIREGRARVDRSVDGGAPKTLAELGQSDGFGEEALLTGEPRNASVTMLSDGLLMRLAKQDFDELLRAPLVNRVAAADVERYLQMGAQLLDVRLEEEYRAGALRSSINIPLYLLRVKATTLDPKKKYIVLCQGEYRSTAAAFLLAQRGFDVCVLIGGLKGLGLIAAAE